MSDNSSLNHKIIERDAETVKCLEKAVVTRLLPATLHAVTCLARGLHHVAFFLRFLRPAATKRPLCQPHYFTACRSLSSPVSCKWMAQTSQHLALQRHSITVIMIFVVIYGGVTFENTMSMNQVISDIYFK
jgi:hypothetical protein